jgi:hypothetical protein
MPLSTTDKKLCKDALQFEYDGVKDFFENNLLEGWSLIELDSKEDEVISKFQVLLRKGCTVADISRCVRDIIDEFREELENDYNEDFVLDAEVQSEDLFGLDHVNFQWTKSMIKKAKDLEDATNKSKKLKTWEHSYKKAVESGVDIMELDESIKSTISKYLRDMKGAKKKGAKRKDKRSKNKRSKKSKSK